MHLFMAFNSFKIRIFNKSPFSGDNPANEPIKTPEPAPGLIKSALYPNHINYHQQPAEKNKSEITKAQNRPTHPYTS